MRSTCRHSNCFGGIVLIFLATMIFSGSAQAQSQDFQIMVNGPWSYVLDPQPDKDLHSKGLLGENRIVLIAPSDHHCAYVFSGPDATSWPSSLCDQPTGLLSPSSSAKIAFYYLDFTSSVQDHSLGEPGEEAPQLYAPSQIVPAATIDRVLNNPVPSNPRYAISLPMPDYISTYTGDYGSGFAESKVKVGHINYKTLRHEYTTWLVLHYSVNQPLKFVGLYSDGSVGSAVVTVPVTSDYNRSGISIAAFDDSMGSDTYCDYMSVKTFSSSAKMWGLHEHVRFPEELDDAGTQNTGFYHYDCDEGMASYGDAAKQQGDVEGSRPAAIASHLQTTKKHGGNASALTASVAKLTEDLRQLLRPGTHEIPKSYLDDWKAAHDELLAYRERIPKFADRVLSCTLALVEQSKDTKFQSCPSGQILLKELSTAPVYKGLTVGSTDCHPGQININNAFSDILN